MPDTTESFLRDQLVERRQRLESSARVVGLAGGIAELLSEVDAALARIETGTYGLCESCHDTIEKDRLLADPLVRLCLDHLTEGQRRALEQDLELAGQLQRGLLPQANLQFGGWAVSYHYRPLGLVSGDYCDLVARENGSTDLFFALGDVSGKGVAASMLMSQLHAIFRTLATTDLPAHALVERASHIFCETTMSTFFATLICGRADSSGGIELCNAGHCPALVGQRGKVMRLEATGVPIGMFCDGRYSTQQVRLAPGETLLLYTDGVSEARSYADEEFGEDRLVEFLSQQSQLPPEALIHACLDHLNAFCSGQPLLDDLTIMAIQRTP
jgi:phosphoserine phosphatase RsbU/P